ncbi:MAG TPA: hypothetical protein VIX63_10075 [Vicinamibacterales bacterium]
MPHVSSPSDVVGGIAVVADGPRESAEDRWGWIELFAAIQLLSGALLFIPGVQPYRMYIRALPYVASLGALVFVMRRSSGEPLPASCRWLLASFALLTASLLHADTHLKAGLAQLIFQFSIGAPMFWAAQSVRSPKRLARLLWVIFAASLGNAALGVLQAYYPNVFLPPEFSALARSLNPTVLADLSYVGSNGQRIIRPPGLSDMPGGAAVGGLTTVVLGVAYVSHEGHRTLVRMLGAGAVAVGMTALYLTQIRALTVMAAVGLLVFAAVRLRQGQMLRGGGIAAGGATLVAVSFMWASAIGGNAIEDRFSTLMETGLFDTYQQNRGLFLDYTLRELLFQFPLGAGLGRWGMMGLYFKDPSMWYAPPIHVEIQITGWLLDGGALMWLCYGGALASACRLAFMSAVKSSALSLGYLSAVVLAFQLAIVGLCFAGPVFNTQLGVLFWTVTGALSGAIASLKRSGPDETDG